MSSAARTAAPAGGAGQDRARWFDAVEPRGDGARPVPRGLRPDRRRLRDRHPIEDAGRFVDGGRMVWVANGENRSETLSHRVRPPYRALTIPEDRDTMEITSATVDSRRVMSDQLMLKNLAALHTEEERLRAEACRAIRKESQLELHISMVGNAINLSDKFRMLPTDDEDMKAVQALGVRVFNCFGSSLKLALSGYWAGSALDMRLILETVFLLDLVESDRSLIGTWRLGNQKQTRVKFSPQAIRKALDKRDNLNEKKRQQHYNLLSALSAHPTMKSIEMMRPRGTGEIQAAPFMDLDFLRNVLFEMARLGLMFGNILDRFFFDTWVDGHEVRAEYRRVRDRWLSANDVRFC